VGSAIAEQLKSDGAGLCPVALRARLAASPLGGLRPGEKVVDLFCGAGGWGEGAKLLGIPVDFAVNHWPVAIDTHRTNNPGTRHHLGDAWRARPRDVVMDALIGLLLASAACTTHSRASGKAPVSKRVHMLGTCILRWAQDTMPRLILVENVPEWRDWGPLIQRKAKRARRGAGFEWEWVDRDGKVIEKLRGPNVWTVEGRRWARTHRDHGRKVRPCLTPDPARKGQYYRWFLGRLRTLGYAVEDVILDAPDFGEASRRRRLFIQARRDGQPIVWPEKTHGKVDADGARRRHKSEGECGAWDRARASGRAVDQGAARRRLRTIDALDGAEVHPARAGGCGEGPGLHPHRSAAECIDWSDLGRSIFDRKRPLKPKTEARIAEGIRRYVIADANPFVLRVTQSGEEGKGWRVSPIDQPFPTQTTRQDLAFSVPVMATTRNGERPGQAPRCHSVRDTLMTVTGNAGGGQGVGCPIIAPQNGGVYGGRIDQPGPTVTTKGHQALISCVVGGAGGSVYAGKPRTLSAPMGTVKCDDRRFLGTSVLMNNTTGHPGGRVDQPSPTITTGGQTVLVTPVATYMRHGGGQHSDVRAPLGAILAGATHAHLLCPMLSEYYSSGSGETLRPANQTLGAVTTLDRHAAVNVVMSSWELQLERGRKVARWLVEHLGDVVPIDEETGLAYVVIGGVRRFFVDVLFRMLKPRELAKAMGFPDSYAWPRTQRDTVRLIGNAVSVRTARALLGACLPRGLRREEAAA
jgi:DNA (cytosine-5)-methyltransferase 1